MLFGHFIIGLEAVAMRERRGSLDAFDLELDPEAEEPRSPPPSRLVPTWLLLMSVAAGFVVLAVAALLPSNWSVARLITNIVGWVLEVPVLFLFFRAFHGVVPRIIPATEKPDGSDTEVPA
jgi:sterol desaturase/sphingolipid hydroxylase (fatty acid hydroxylase superfamily)